MKLTIAFLFVAFAIGSISAKASHHHRIKHLETVSESTMGHIESSEVQARASEPDPTRDMVNKRRISFLNFEQLEDFLKQANAGEFKIPKNIKDILQNGLNKQLIGRNH